MAKSRNLATGRKWGAEIANLKETQVRFAEIVRAMDGEDKSVYRAAKERISKRFVEVSRYLRDKARLNVAMAGGPQRVRAAIFAFTDFDASRVPSRKRSTLVGVRTGAPPRHDPHIFFTWGRGSTRRKGGGIAHRGIGMSLGRIFESGTRFVRGSRYFRNAVFSTKTTILRQLADAYKDAVRMMSDK